jgi:hypothetical protein
MDLYMYYLTRLHDVVVNSLSTGTTLAVTFTFQTLQVKSEVVTVSSSTNYIYLSMTLQPFVGPWPLFFSFLIFYTVGRTPWTAD